MGHTPGPWTIRSTDDGKPAESGYPDTYAIIGPHEDGEKWVQIPAVCDNEDNAVLIAAAPELLAACKAALIEIEAAWQAEGTYFGPDRDIDKKIKAAVARAEGTK